MTRKSSVSAAGAVAADEKTKTKTDFGGAFGEPVGSVLVSQQSLNTPHRFMFSSGLVHTIH